VIPFNFQAIESHPGILIVAIIVLVALLNLVAMVWAGLIHLGVL
jgi:hypothetical protein